MSSANYIPLTQISPSEFFWSPKAALAPTHSSWISRKRALLALVAATSLVTLLVFFKISVYHDDFTLEDIAFRINPAYQPSYIAIPVPDALPPAAHPRIRPVRELPTECLERYYASGLSCHDGKGPVPMDIVWTWVNGSDPLFLDARERAANSFDENDPTRPIQSNNPSRMFRYVSLFVFLQPRPNQCPASDHDELRHSIRSVLANFRPYTTRFHILTSDFDYPDDPTNRSFPVPGPGYWRLGLQPQWLETPENDTSEWRDGDVRLSLTHHAHFFEPYNQSSFNRYVFLCSCARVPRVPEHR